MKSIPLLPVFLTFLFFSTELVHSSPNIEIIELPSPGEAYPILERDMVSWLRERSALLRESIRKERESALERYTPLDIDLPFARKERLRFYNPEVVLHSPLLDHQGKILLPVGHRDNPLRYRSLPRPLLFFDGRDKAQVDFARQESEKGALILLMTAGDRESVSRTIGKAVHAVPPLLIKKIPVEKVPTLLYQARREEHFLRVREIALGE